MSRFLVTRYIFPALALAFFPSALFWPPAYAETLPMWRSNCLQSAAESSAAASGAAQNTTVINTFRSNESGEVRFTGLPRAIRIDHFKAIYNCCIQEIEMRAEAMGERRIRVIEREILEAPCDCICPYDLATTLTILEPGRYWIELARETTPTLEIIASAWVIVADYRFYASPCMRSQEAAPGDIPDAKDGFYRRREALDGKITYEITSGTLQVHHRGAIFNCCLSSLALNLRIEGETLYLIESAVLEGRGCYCMCSYDLDASISGLPSGWYPVAVILESTGEPLAEFRVLIEAGAQGSLWALY